MILRRPFTIAPRSNSLIRSRTVRILVAAAGFSLFYVLGLFVREQYGIAIVIQNESGGALRRIRVKAEPTGRVISLGDLANEQHTRVFVEPRTESHIRLGYTDASGQPHVEIVVGYAEAGYCGEAEVKVLPGDKATSKENIDPVICWNSWLGFL